MKAMIRKYPGGEVYLLGAGASLPPGEYEVEIPDPPRTPGQLAFEAFWEEAPPGSTHQVWEKAGEAQRLAWEAAARAVLEAKP